MSVLRLLLESAFEFALITAIALTATAILRRRSAALRHWILSSALACGAVAPVLGLVVPSWHVPLDAVSAPPVLGQGEQLATADATASGSPTDAERAGGPARTTLATAANTIVGIWAAGAGLNLALLLAGIWRLTRVRSRSHPILDRRWTDLARDMSRAYGLRRAVALLQSDHPTLIVTWGMVRPEVIVPRAAAEWTDDRARVVLAHELAHVQRRDWPVQMAAELLRAVYWFNPFAWIICRQLRHESEHATDDKVLNAGVDGGHYASHLLDLARAVRDRHEAWWPAPAIVRSSTLERRIAAMLSSHVNRRPLTRTVRLGTVGALFGLAAAIASAQGALATFSGSLLDPMNRSLPNARLVLTHVQTSAKHEVRSDGTGRFEFAGLPSGEYVLQVQQMGFRTLEGRVSITGNSVQQNLTLQIGTLEETVLVRPGESGTPSAPSSEDDALREAKRRQREREAMACGSTPQGGNVRPPMKLTHVAPQYPLHLGNAGIDGTVGMQAVIAKDGSIRDVHLVRPAHPDFNAAALAAIRQWRFDSTLLNCMPVEVTMRVTVNFKAS